MKKSYLLLSAFIGLSGAVFSACSSEEDSPIVDNNADNAIRFAANTEFSEPATSPPTASRHSTCMPIPARRLRQMCS